MYKVASDKRQATLYRGRLEDWINGDERLSEADQKAQLRDGLKILEGRLSAAQSTSERKAIIEQKRDFENKLRLLRDRQEKAPPDWKLHFVNEAKRILSDSQFRMIEAAAKHEAALKEKKREIAHTENA